MIAFTVLGSAAVMFNKEKALNNTQNDFTA